MRRSFIYCRFVKRQNIQNFQNIIKRSHGFEICSQKSRDKNRNRRERKLLLFPTSFFVERLQFRQRKDDYMLEMCDSFIKQTRFLHSWTKKNVALLSNCNNDVDGWVSFSFMHFLFRNDDAAFQQWPNRKRQCVVKQNASFENVSRVWRVRRVTKRSNK